MGIPTGTDDTALFTQQDLTDWLGGTVTDVRARIAERVVWGWLKPALGTETRPDPVPDEVFSWAVELGAIAHENPAGLTSKQLGSSQRAFSAERRTAILAEVTASSAGGAGHTGPQGSFPNPQVYPDPAESFQRACPGRR